MYYLHRTGNGISGTGARARAVMSLYRNPNYNQAYPSGNVSLPVGSPLYVGVSVEERDPNFVSVLENCYASLSSNPDDLRRQYFIQNKWVRAVCGVQSNLCERVSCAAMTNGPLHLLRQVSHRPPTGRSDSERRVPAGSLHRPALPAPGRIQRQFPSLQPQLV